MKLGEKDKSVSVPRNISIPDRIAKLQEMIKNSKDLEQIKSIKIRIKELKTTLKTSSTVKNSIDHPLNNFKPTYLKITQILSLVKLKGYKVVKNSSGSITITKIKAPTKK